MVRRLGIDSDEFIRKDRKKKLMDIATKQFGAERIVPLEPVRLSDGKEYSSCFGIQNENSAITIHVLTDVYTVFVIKQRDYDLAEEFANKIQSETGREPTLTEYYF